MKTYPEAEFIAFTTSMETQFTFVSREDIWRLHADMKNVYAVQAEHADRLLRLEKRQDDEMRLKSVWGTSSPFPTALTGTPHQGQQAPSQDLALHS